MTEIRMKECSGHRRATKVRFLDKEREILIEGSYKTILQSMSQSFSRQILINSRKWRIRSNVHR